MGLNNQVRDFWEQEPCGTYAAIVADAPAHTREWYERVETHRYEVEPYIHSVAQFTRHHGEKILEVGVGAGTDHLQWARAGAECNGVDLTDAAIETTRERLALYGFRSNLQRVDAEILPFADNTFDVVYSWGVIHHSEKPEKIIAEIHRVLKPGGVFIGMMYGRRSALVFKTWVVHALRKGKPFRSFADVVWNHIESVGTKAYTPKELQSLFADFQRCEANPILTIYDTQGWPARMSAYFPDKFGWFIPIKAYKQAAPELLR